MLYTDQHVHTSYSPDSEAKIADYLIEAKKRGLDYVIFTDHADMGAIEEAFKKQIDYQEYFKVMKRFEEQYEIEIRVGIEIGYEINYKNQINELLNEYPFDFVIGSIHYGDGKDLYLGDFYQGKSQYDSYMRYFELMLEMVENFTNFDVIGHLDYIVRYAPFVVKDYEYKVYKEIIDLILKTVIKKGKGIELNTSGLRGPLKTILPKEEVLIQYKELGGKIITVGSDAHSVKEYYAGMSDEINHLERVGFSELSSFSKRKVKQHKMR
ncbi:histidinol-phosphatase HisJ family protein [Carnobacterium sp. TMP28]|uniref:histidinol-phosphatase HisJ family protein n=1 Tax=Carnobacterium sp. TMP28 TaxID=3397060 RepID=UPI0039DF5146